LQAVFGLKLFGGIGLGDLGQVVMLTGCDHRLLTQGGQDMASTLDGRVVVWLACFRPFCAVTRAALVL
jgi:hypothetical protein